MKTNDKQTKRNGLNIWAVVAILGLFLAICTMNESRGEIGLRAVGVVCFAIGAYMGGWMSHDSEVNDLNESNDLNDLNESKQ